MINRLSFYYLVYISLLLFSYRLVNSAIIVILISIAQLFILTYKLLNLLNKYDFLPEAILLGKD